jgi:NaMN:DMB phosphoribosyltransferase
MAHLPGTELEAGTAAAAREQHLTKPAGVLGRLEEMVAWLATWQGRHDAGLIFASSRRRFSFHASAMQVPAIRTAKL